MELVAAAARFAAGVAGFLAVLGVIGLVLWSVTAVVAFRRAPLWKRLTFAAEAMSLGLDFMIQESGSGEVWRLNELFLNMGRGFGGC